MRHDGDTRLDGKRIAVTGTSRGLGRALVEAFVGAGAMVIAHARRGAEAVRRELGAARALDGDLRDPSLPARLAAEADAMGGLDALVLNAGMLGAMGRLETIDFAGFREVMETNVDAQLRLFVALRPALLASRGAVIWLSSGVGRFGVPGYGAYAVSKHAVEGLNRLAHAENGPDGLVSIALAPGMVQTDMLRAALGRDDVSGFARPADAAAGFVRLLASIDQRRDALAGASIDLSDVAG